MSFNLQPESRNGWESPDKIVWTVPRSTIPPMLQGRGISLSTWEKTFDAVYTLYEEQHGHTRKIMPFVFIPCLIPCMMPSLISQGLKRREAWLNVLKRQQIIYQPYGIQVTLAKELNSVGSSNHDYVTVGLRFTLGPMPNSGPYDPNNMFLQTQQSPTTTYYNNTNTTTNNSNSSNLIERLERLDELHRNGAISTEEYSKAKTRILNN